MGICRAVRWACNNPYSIGMFRHFLFGPTLQLTAITRRLNLDSKEYKREGHLKMYLRVIFAFISGLFHLFSVLFCFVFPAKLSLSAHVYYRTVKQVISRRRLDENGLEMYKNEKHTCKACKTSDAVSSC